MKNETITANKSKAFSAYMQLNEANKKELRKSFCTEFNYESEDSFYRKMHNTALFWSNEKKWIAEKLNTTVTNLFGKTIKA